MTMLGKIVGKNDIHVDLGSVFSIEIILTADEVRDLGKKITALAKAEDNKLPIDMDNVYSGSNHSLTFIRMM